MRRSPGSTRAPGSPQRRGAVLRTAMMATAGLAVVGGGGAAIWLPLRSSSSSGTGTGTLEIHSVNKTSFDISTTCSGELEAKNQIEIRSKLDSMSTIVFIVEEGKTVKAGDVLVRLNSDELQNKIREEDLQRVQAVAEMQAAETELKVQEKENDSKLQAAKVKVTLAELSLKQWEEGELVQKKKDNTQAIEKAEAERTRLKEKYEKSVDLEKEGFISTDELKRDKLSYDDSERDYDKAILAQRIYNEYQEPKDRTSKESDLNQARSELERVQEQNIIELAGKTSKRETRRQQLAMHEDKLKKYNEQLENATIKAPNDGLVVYATSMERMFWGWGNEGPLQIGRQVHPNELLIALPDTSVMLASVQVHESLASRIKPGLHATVKVEAAGGKTYNGTVESIGVLAESGGWRDPNLREYRVKIALDIGAAAKPPAPAAPADSGAPANPVDAAPDTPAKPTEVATAAVTPPAAPDTTTPAAAPVPAAAATPAESPTKGATGGDAPAAPAPASTTQVAATPQPAADTAAPATAQGSTAVPTPAPGGGAQAAASALKPSMRCEAEIIMGRVEDAVAVPIQAVFNDGPMRYVHIPEGGKYTRRPIKLGRLSERFAEIAAGLTPGEKVLLREPKAGEVLDRAWSDKELASVGLKKGEAGQIVPAEPPAPPAAPGAPSSAPVTKGEDAKPVATVALGESKNPAPTAPAADAPKPAATDPKPAASTAATTTEKPADASADKPAAPEKKSDG